MDNRFIGLIIGLVVGVLMIGSLLVPTINDASTTEKTFTNEGYYTMDNFNESTTKVIEWSKTAPNEIIIDGQTFDFSFAEINKSYTLFGSDTALLRYMADPNATGIQCFSNEVGSTYLSFHTATAETVGDKLTLTFENNTLSYVTNGTNPINKTISDLGTDAYIINPSDSGDYAVVMKRPDVSAYVLGDSVIRFMGVSVTGGPNGIGIYGNGTIDDGMTLSTVYTSNTTTDVSYSNPVPADDAVSGYVNLYSLDKYTFTISYTDNGTPKTYDATYSYFLVPAEVIAERSNHLDAGEIAMIAVIPVLMIASLLIFAVRFVTRD